MIEQLMTNGGAYIGEEVQSERDFIGRDRISITVEESYLQQIWTRLDADLQDALSLAGNQVLREGGEAIALAHLLRALVRLRPDLVEEILPLFLWYQVRNSAKATGTEAQKAKKLMDIDATLQAILGGLLANHDMNHPLDCAELFKVLKPDPERPFPGLLSGAHQRNTIKFFTISECVGNPHAAVGAGKAVAKPLYWRSMVAEEVQARWN